MAIDKGDVLKLPRQAVARPSRCWAEWTDVMVGPDGWPYAQVPVNVVGWALRDRNQVRWNDNSVDIRINSIRGNAAQYCEPCGPFVNRDADNTGTALPEIGHSFGLYDCCDRAPVGVGGSLMKAGTAGEFTEFDKSVFRDWWRHLKIRYGL